MFCHLHAHNEYSVLDGIGTSKQYAKLAKDLDQEYLALTNHGNVDGALEHQKQCLEAGISPIAGAEMYLVSDINNKQKGDRRYHITLLVENITGWQNLLKLLTIANIDGFYHRPRIDHKTLLKHIDGLIVMSACSASFIHHPDHKEMLLDYIEAIGKNKVYLEIMPHDIPQQIETNKVAKVLSEELNIQMVATNDCHYPTAKSAMHQEVLLAIQTKKKWKDKDRWKFNCNGLFFRSEEEMFKAFQEQGCFTDNEIKRAIRRTVSVAKMCADFRIPQQEIHLPSIKAFAAGEEEAFFDNLIEYGIKTRLHGATDRRLKLYRQRIGIELNLIKQKEFIRYFLIVWDVLEWCRKNDIMTGPGRGSSGGSLIAYLLYITDCDPLVYHTEFFRFIAEERNDLPDIDMDIEDIRRGDVRKYLCDKYGEFNVSGLSNFLTMKGKGVFRDVCRVFDIPLKEVDYVAKAIISNGKSGNEIEDSFKTERPCIEFEQDYPHIVEICRSLEGQIRGYGQHAAGLCISKNNLREGINCNLVIRNKELVANWDMRNAEHCGLMKLDLLGLSNLTILNETKRLIKQNHGIDVDFKKLPFNDKAVYQEINKGNTCGAFQINTPSLTNYCMDLGVDNFQMLYAVTALWRPGPIQAGMHEEYKRRKNKKTKIEKIHPVFDKITQETFGVIVYQEQVMKAVNQLAGIPMQTCNKIRKVMGKSLGHEAFDKYREEFLEGCKKQNTVTEKKAEQIWDMMSKFGGYGFNRCLSGDQIIQKGSKNQFAPLTIEEMWLTKNYKEWAVLNNHEALHGKYKYKGYGSALSMNDDFRITDNKIIDITYSGYRDVYLVKTESGKTIKCTNNHKFPTSNGDIQLKNLSVGDYLYVKDKYEEQDSSEANFYRNNHQQKRVNNHPSKGVKGFQKRPNGATVLFNSTRQKNIDDKKSCQICNYDYSVEGSFELHHKNKKRSNNSEDNLLWVCNSCHKKLHYKSGRTKRYEKGILTKKEKITEIKYLGKENTYDVEMDDPYHNFVVESGIVTCNSHSVEYSMITYWDLWAKLYYPNEFIAACLTLGNKDKNVAYMKEAKRLKLKVNLPKIGISDATRWNCDTKGNLYAPFITINGVGEPTAKKIAAISSVKKVRTGFFGVKAQRKYAGIDKTTMDVLTTIKAFEKDYITTEKDLREFRQYFIF